MQLKFRLFLIFFALIITLSCKAQLVETTNDLNKLDTNKKEFIDKHLKQLLKTIKPEIKSVLSNPQNRYLTFFFDSLDFVMKSDYKIKQPAAIRVYVKEPFTWEGRGKYFYFWTKKDEDKYGDLTISFIKIYNRK